jgi:arylsulfatase A
MKKLLLLVILAIAASCTNTEKKPNIILIMADDMGYECLSVNGATEYQTPNLDRLAENGLRFINTFSQPLCTPSRVKIMTGKFNYRNYEYFGYLNPNQKTFGNLMKEAGYKTCISGKWQLNGLSFEMPEYEDVNRPNHFGFDEYCLWQLNRPRKEGERYANPLITQNGVELTGLEDKYGPDIFSDFICDFIDKNADSLFFIYYPMVLVHEPFVPTPDTETWQNQEKRYEKDTSYFKEMMSYTDKIVGKIEQKLMEKGIAENTLLIFTADNGTDTRIITHTTDGIYPGGKSFTTQRGIHVPMIASWPAQIKNSGIYDGIIDFGDFYPTLAEIVNLDISEEVIDGQSFLNVFKGTKSPGKSAALIHYDPEWGRASQNRNRFALNNKYKLYQNGELYEYRIDIDEMTSLTDLTAEEIQTKVQLEELLNKAETESPWKNQGQ